MPASTSLDYNPAVDDPADTKPLPDVPEKPADYGQWWNTNEHGADWYRTIYGYRRKAHEYFLRWFWRANELGPAFRSVLEVGCGRGDPYAALLENYQYTGIDISQKEIEWCRQHYRTPRHRFWCGDFLTEEFRERSDLVFSHAVIDHVYDINRFLARMVSVSNRCIFLTAYRGWFDGLAWLPMDASGHLLP